MPGLRRPPPPESVDWSISCTAAAAAWRALIFTPPAHYFYTFIDRVIRTPATGGIARRLVLPWAAKVAVDGLLWLPPIRVV